MRPRYGSGSSGACARVRPVQIGTEMDGRVDCWGYAVLLLHRQAYAAMCRSGRSAKRRVPEKLHKLGRLSLEGDQATTS
jgi:hypothetical protein